MVLFPHIESVVSQSHQLMPRLDGAEGLLLESKAGGNVSRATPYFSHTSGQVRIEGCSSLW